MEWIWLAVGIGVLLVVVLLVWRPLWLFGQEVQLERARELFRLQRERLEAMFFTAASQTGKPRGLRWKNCDFETTMELARDRQNGQIIALVPVTIAFEAIEGGDMEGVEAVGNLRNASAVFYLDRGHWETVGKAVFNMNPNEALVHFKNQYERIDTQKEEPRGA